MKKSLIFISLFTLISISVYGQGNVSGPPIHVICDSGCSGSGPGGDVNQGTGGSSAWSVLFLAPQHFILDSAPTLAVTGTFFQAVQPVSGTFWQATQPVSIAATVSVSGPLTDTQIRATPLSITGSVTVGDGSGPLTVDGTVTSNAGTNLNTSLLALESGNLSIASNYLNQIYDLENNNLGYLSIDLPTITTNTDPLVDPDNGGYVRQDSTATIAKETGGNLAGVRTAVETIDNFISGSRGLVTEDNSSTISTNTATIATNTGIIAGVVDTVGTSMPTSAMIIGGMDTSGKTTMLQTVNGNLTTLSISSPGLPKQPCNAVRRTNCQSKGY